MYLSTSKFGDQKVLPDQVTTDSYNEILVADVVAMDRGYSIMELSGPGMAVSLGPLPIEYKNDNYCG